MDFHLLGPLEVRDGIAPSGSARAASGASLLLLLCIATSRIESSG